MTTRRSHHPVRKCLLVFFTYVFFLFQLGTGTALAQETAVPLSAVPASTNQIKMFEDIPRDHWAYDAIRELTSHGIMIGYFDRPQNTFRGERNLTRYEFAYALHNAVLKIEDDIRKEQKNVDIEEFLRSKNVSPKDIELLSLLMQEFKKDLNDMNMRVAKLEDMKKKPSSPKTPFYLSIAALVISVVALVLAASSK
jgi:hypothetical protein